MQIIKGENRLIKLEEPLEEVFHDNTLIGKGTKGSKLRTNGGGIHDSTLFGDGTASQPLTLYTVDDIILTEDGKGIVTEDGEYLLIESATVFHGIYDGSASLNDDVEVGLNGKSLSFYYTIGDAGTGLELDDDAGTAFLGTPNGNTSITLSDVAMTFAIGVNNNVGAFIVDDRVSPNNTGLQYDSPTNFVNSSLVSRDYADGLGKDTPDVTIDAQSVPGRYRALLRQTGTSNPEVFVTLNTLGGDVVWTRNDVGIYHGTLAGAFPNSYPHCLANYTPLRGGVANVSLGVLGDGDTIVLYSLNASTGNPEEIDCGTAWDVSIDVTIYND